MTEMIVGGKSVHILISRLRGEIVARTMTMSEIYDLAVDGALFAQDADEFTVGNAYFLIKGEVIVPVVKVEVGGVEVTS